jgi:hypothetical protein
MEASEAAEKIADAGERADDKFKGRDALDAQQLLPDSAEIPMNAYER